MASAGQNVHILDSDGEIVSDFGGVGGSGTEYTEGATDATITGQAILWEDTSDTLRAVSAAKPLPISDAGGNVSIDDGGNSITVDAPVGTPVFVSQTPSATGGWSTFMATSGDGSTALTATAQSIKGSAGKLGGWYIYNPNSSATYVILYNVAQGSVTVGTTNPQMVVCIPATSGANCEFANGIAFDTAISVAATTTGGGNSAPSSALEANFFYK